MLIYVGNGELEELITYNDLSNLIEQQVDDEPNAGPNYLYSFDKVIGHQGPIKPSDPRYKGSSYNVLVQWTSGDETYESLNLMIKDDPITLAVYAKDNNLLDTPGWTQLKHFVRCDKKFQHMLNQTKLQSKHRGVWYKFGVQVPQDWREAVVVDTANGNTLWQDATKTEFAQIDENSTFDGKGVGYKPGADYQKINVHLIFDVKHDLKLG
jgi:hypothetical protein